MKLDPVLCDKIITRTVRKLNIRHITHHSLNTPPTATATAVICTIVEIILTYPELDPPSPALLRSYVEYTSKKILEKFYLSPSHLSEIVSAAVARKIHLLVDEGIVEDIANMGYALRWGTKNHGSYISWFIGGIYNMFDCTTYPFTFCFRRSDPDPEPEGILEPLVT